MALSKSNGARPKEYRWTTVKRSGHSVNSLRKRMSMEDIRNECKIIQPACVDTKKKKKWDDAKRVESPTDEMNGKGEIYQMKHGAYQAF